MSPLTIFLPCLHHTPKPRRLAITIALPIVTLFSAGVETRAHYDDAEESLDQSSSFAAWSQRASRHCRQFSLTHRQWIVITASRARSATRNTDHSQWGIRCCATSVAALRHPDRHIQPPAEQDPLPPLIALFTAASCSFYLLYKQAGTGCLPDRHNGSLLPSFCKILTRMSMRHIHPTCYLSNTDNNAFFSYNIQGWFGDAYAGYQLLFFLVLFEILRRNVRGAT